MEQILTDILKQSPLLACCIAMAITCARWFEKQSDNCHKRHAQMIETYQKQNEKNVGVAEKLHQALGGVQAALERCARTHEDVERALRER